MFFRWTLVLTVVFALISCGLFDNKEDKTYTTFHASFVDGWLGYSQGVIFISDMDGNYLGRTYWEGDSSFDIPPENDVTFPSKVVVTTVEIENKYVWITSNMQVEPSSWKWKGYPNAPSTAGSVTIDLSNVNTYDYFGYITSDLWRAYYSSLLIILYTLPCRKEIRICISACEIIMEITSTRGFPM